jgi:hypothetical protein
MKHKVERCIEAHDRGKIYRSQLCRFTFDESYNLSLIPWRTSSVAQEIEQVHLMDIPPSSSLMELHSFMSYSEKFALPHPQILWQFVPLT